MELENIRNQHKIISEYTIIGTIRFTISHRYEEVGKDTIRYITNLIAND